MTAGVAQLRLVIPAASAWLTAFLVIALPHPQWLAVGATAATVVAAIVVIVRRVPWLGTVAVALAAVALVGASATGMAARRSPQVLAAAAESSRHVDLRATVTGSAHEGRIPATAHSVTLPGRHGRTHAIEVPVLIFGDAHAKPPAIGATLSVRGAVRATEPGDDVEFLVFPRGPPEIVAAPAPLLDWTGGLRDGLARAAARLPGDGGDLLPGLAIGDTSAVGMQLQQSMRASSLTHLTAVSGANCAVVVALALGMTRLLGLRRGLRIVTALALLGGFVLLVTPEPSVQRAAAMAAIALIASAVGRGALGIPVLSAAVIGLLALDPWLARDYGFVLSMLATLALLTLVRPLTDALGKVMPRPLALMIAVPVAAQLLCQPVIVLLDPTIPLYGVPANLLAVPAAPIATIVGLVACVMVPLLPPVGAAVTAVAWLPSAWIAAVANVVAGLPAARLPWLPGILGGLSLAVVSAVMVLAMSGRGRRIRVMAGALTALVVVGYLGLHLGTRIARDADRPHDWTVAQCDIGQGDAVLIRSGAEVALIDTGPEPARLTTCLDALGIGRIDLLVLTHYDLDHVGGVDAVVGRVGRALVGPSDGASDERIASRLASAGAQVDRVRRGDRGTLGDLDWQVVWPPDRGVEPGNSASVTLSIRPIAGCVTGCVSILMLGDLGEESQNRMLARLHPAHHDIVKVAHHGSADQSADLYLRVAAALGLLGVGADNDYGHPADEALAMLDVAGTATFRSDLDGLVLVSEAADAVGRPELRVWTERRRPPPVG